MIDEWYDRTYLDCRAELNAAILRFFARAVRKIPPIQQEKTPCTPSPSPPSPSR